VEGELEFVVEGSLTGFANGCCVLPIAEAEKNSPSRMYCFPDALSSGS
jgi:hypothetical protein